MTINTDPGFVLDLYETNKKYKRTTREALEMLEIALHALDKGKVDVVRDHMERVVASLRRT